MLADCHPAFKRIMSCGPWKWTKWQHNGKSGVLAFQDDADTAGHAAPITCKDGLIYFGYKDMPDQSVLARESIPNSFSVTLASGRVISVPMAIAAPRFMSFDGMSQDEHATDFGKEAFRIWGNIAQKQFPSDADSRKLVFLAINQNYKVTEESLTQLNWITDVDIVPIMLAVSGRDPKLVAAEKDTSNLSAAG